MQRIIVTGGTGGIGSACVQKLCEEGHDVTFFYRSNEEKAKWLERVCQARGIQCDLREQTGVRDAVLDAGNRMNGIDALVLCAGVAQIAPVQDLTESDWENLFEINFHSVRRVIKESLPQLLKSLQGRIVIIGSVWGRTGASCESAYSATKGALRALTLSLSKELGPSKITVNCIEPGFIDTNMNSELSEADRREVILQTPLGRVGTGEDVADAVSFLLSRRASFITGQCLGVDGGFPC